MAELQELQLHLLKHLAVTDQTLYLMLLLQQAAVVVQMVTTLQLLVVQVVAQVSSTVLEQTELLVRVTRAETLVAVQVLVAVALVQQVVTKQEHLLQVLMVEMV